jgi:hypothetical protein
MLNPEHETIEVAFAAYKAAAEALIAEIKSKYPVGTIISCCLGKHRVKLEITGHSSSYWYEPQMLYGKNVKTGKSRKVSATYEGSEIITLSTP